MRRHKESEQGWAEWQNRVTTTLETVVVPAVNAAFFKPWEQIFSDHNQVNFIAQTWPEQVSVAGHKNCAWLIFLDGPD